VPARRIGATLTALVALVALAGTAAACGNDTSPTLATVNNQVVTAADLDVEIDGIHSIDGLYRDYGLDSFPPAGQVLPVDVAAQVLTGVLHDKLLHKLRVDRNLPASDACRQAARVNLGLELAGVAGGGNPDDLVNRLPKAYRQSRLDREEDQVVLGSAFVDADGDGTPDGVNCDPERAVDGIVAALVCVRVMPVTSPDQGNAAAQRLRAGESFATVAAEVAPGQSAVAQCGARSSFIAPLQQATAGQILGPLLVNATQLEVVEVVDPQSVRSTVLSRLPAAIEAGLARAKQLAFQNTSGTIDARLGRWDPASATVVPSSGASSSPGASPAASATASGVPSS
jgi:hypothetical protein